ncbi:hypothetical protein DSO57_1001866 [Entomophthora muscae]|uniref:Uncharacterized protein n=1 Tax=Entomophthora muscae TaxID=34485 RepID=A0ACC2TJU1_9FUNG|nr:hypothetical protein DSO57_1001866 [Entomophthora muscae]
MFSYDLVFPFALASRASSPLVPNSRFYMPTLFLTTVYLGKYIEFHLKGKSFKILDRLLSLRPATAIVIARSQDFKGRHTATELEMEIELIKGIIIIIII